MPRVNPLECPHPADQGMILTPWSWVSEGRALNCTAQCGDCEEFITIMGHPDEIPKEDQPPPWDPNRI